MTKIKKTILSRRLAGLKTPIQDYLVTPSILVNLCCGGGLKAGSISEIYGSNGSGKSTFCCNLASLMRNTDPYTRITILDTENSVDTLRMKTSFNLAPHSYSVIKPANLENSFARIVSILEESKYITHDKNNINKLPKISKVKTWKPQALTEYIIEAINGYNEENSTSQHQIKISDYINSRTKVVIDKEEALVLLFHLNKVYTDLPPHHLILFDTIATSIEKDISISIVSQANDTKIDKDSNVDQFASGRNYRQRMIKERLGYILSHIDHSNVTLIFINQVIATMGGPYKPATTSAGGNAFQHAIQYRFKIEQKKFNKDDDTKLPQTTVSGVTIEKNKFGIKIGGNIATITIDDSLGARIDPQYECVNASDGLKIIVKPTAGWYSFQEDIDDPNIAEPEKYRWTTTKLATPSIIGNRAVMKRCMRLVFHYFRKNYSGVDESLTERGVTLGQLSKEEKINYQMPPLEVDLFEEVSDIDYSTFDFLKLPLDRLKFTVKDILIILDVDQKATLLKTLPNYKTFETRADLMQLVDTCLELIKNKNK